MEINLNQLKQMFETSNTNSDSSVKSGSKNNSDSSVFDGEKSGYGGKWELNSKSYNADNIPNKSEELNAINEYLKRIEDGDILPFVESYSPISIDLPVISQDFRAEVLAKLSPTHSQSIVLEYNKTIESQLEEWKKQNPSPSDYEESKEWRKKYNAYKSQCEEEYRSNNPEFVEIEEKYKEGVSTFEKKIQAATEKYLATNPQQPSEPAKAAEWQSKMTSYLEGWRSSYLENNPDFAELDSVFKRDYIRRDYLNNRIFY